MIELSFVIPTYNVEKYIDRCLNSIYSQSVDEKRYEVIVVDDGSKDSTVDILRKWQKYHGNLRVETQENHGPSVARNKGIDLSKGKFLWFVDSDDYILDNALDVFLSEASREDVDVFFFPFKLIEPDGLSYNATYPSLLMDGIMTGKDAIKNGFNKWAVWMAGWNKNYINRLNLRFLTDVCRGEDAFFAYCAVIQTKRMKVIKTSLYVYERKEGGLTTASNLTMYKKQRMGEVIVLRSLLDLCQKIGELDEESYSMAYAHYNKLRFGLILTLFKNRKRCRKDNINEEIISIMKKNRMYPLKGPFLSLKYQFLSFFLNNEHLIK